MTYSVEVINQHDLKQKLPRPQSHLLLVDDLLVVCVENEKRIQGFIYALEYAKTGMPERWRLPLSEGDTTRFAVYSPQNQLLLSSVSNWHTTFDGNSYLLAVDARSGNELWRFPADKKLIDISAPLIVQNKLFVLSGGNAILLSLDSPGTIIWSKPFPFHPHWLYRGLVADETMIYVSVRENRVVEISQSNGEQQREFFVPEGEVWLAAAVTDNDLFAASSTGRLIAFNKITGEQKWAVQVGRGVTTGPMIYAAALYVGTKSAHILSEPATYQIVALNTSDGQPSGFAPFTLGANAHFHAPLIVTPNGVLLCGSNNKNVYALDIHTGQKLWHHYLQSELTCQPVVTTEGHIIIASRKGVINVLRVTHHSVAAPPVLPKKPNSTPADQPTAVTQRKLVEFLRKYFTISELLDFCQFSLEINHETFETNTIENFTRGLVTYYNRHGRLQELEEMVRASRPNIPWS